jgi:hypothetical protein
VHARGRDGARSPWPKPAQWHVRPRLVGARGGARPAAQARGSLGAGARQGVRRGSSPKWRAGGEGVPSGDPGEVL